MGAIGLLWYPISLAFIVLVGVLKLEQPLGRDQAVHAWMAQRMMEGAVAYRDVWDVRQPAIFALHTLAIALFGPSVRGVHLVELGWMLLLALLIMVLLRGYYRHRWLSAAAAVAAIAPYYVFVEPYSRMQVEILVGLPFFLTAWFLWRASASDRHVVALAFAAGVAAGIGTAFKHVLAPIPVAFALLAAWFTLRRPRTVSATAAVGRLWIAFAAGVIAVWLVIFLVFLFQGAFADFFWTNFIWPLENLHVGDPAPLSRLIEGVLVFFTSTAAWALLALAAVGGLFRSEEPKFTSFLWAWIIAGAGAMLMQRTSWWAYHFLLFYVPIGLLGVRGIDRIVGGLVDRGTLSRFAAMGMSALLVLLPLAGLVRPMGEQGRAIYKAFVVEKKDADTYRREYFPEYAGAAAVADYLKSVGGNDPVYVIDNLTPVLLSHRDIGQPVPGQWFGSLRPAERLLEIPKKIEANPPRFFFVENRIAADFAKYSPSLQAMLDSEYHVVLDIPFGRLFELDPPEATPAASPTTGEGEGASPVPGTIDSGSGETNESPSAPASSPASPPPAE